MVVILACRGVASVASQLYSGAPYPVSPDDDVVIGVLTRDILRLLDKGCAATSTGEAAFWRLLALVNAFFRKECRYGQRLEGRGLGYMSPVLHLCGT